MSHWDIAAYYENFEEVNHLSNFPICGNDMETVGVPNAKLMYEVENPYRQALWRGEQNIVTNVILYAEDQDVEVTYLSFQQIVAGSPEHYSNAQLYVDGVLYPLSLPASIAGGWVDMTVANNPILVTVGQPVTVQLLLDFDADTPPCTEYNFDISATGITAVDTQFNSFVDIYEGPDSNSPPVADYVAGEEVMAALSSYSPPAGLVTAGATDVEFMAFRLDAEATGPVWWFDVDIVLENGAQLSDLSNLKVWLRHSGQWDFPRVYPTLNATCVGNRCTMNLDWPNTNVIEFSGCDTREFMITMDVASSASSGSTYRLEIDRSTFFGEVPPYNDPADFGYGIFGGDPQEVQ